MGVGSLPRSLELPTGSVGTMADYTAPLDDIRFVLDRIASHGELSSMEGFGHAEPDVVHGNLDECARCMPDKVAPLNRVGDVATSVWHAEDKRVNNPTGLIAAYEDYV